MNDVSIIITAQSERLSPVHSAGDELVRVALLMHDQMREVRSALPHGHSAHYLATKSTDFNEYTKFVHLST